MKDEIKEILESSRKIIKSNRENGFDRIIMLGDDIDKLCNYITNLEEKLEDYKSRINKAIEYGKELRLFDNESLEFEIGTNFINILKGENK